MIDDRNTQDIPYQTIPIHLIEPDDECIRKTDTDIGGLKYTISDVGLLQPIIVRKAGDKYVVIDGHRRLRALRELDVTDLIVGREVIVNANEKDADNRFKQIIANIQREDIGDIELGRAFVTLKEVYGYKYNEIAEVIGKDRHYVTAKVNLATRLAPEVRELAVYDMEAAGASKNNEEPEPYIMNINILEAIARLPEGLQADVYRKVKGDEMDRSEAYKLIRTLKAGGADRGGISERPVGDSAGDGLDRYVKKVNKDLDLLAFRIKEDVGAEKEKILPAIESLIDRLNSLRSAIAEDDRIAGKGKYEVELREMA